MVSVQNGVMASVIVFRSDYDFELSCSECRSLQLLSRVTKVPLNSSVVETSSLTSIRNSLASFLPINGLPCPLQLEEGF